MAIEKKYEHMKVQVKKGKKCGHMKVQEKKIAMSTKESKERQYHAKWSYNKSDGNN
jgi:hypothetical protein